MTRRWPTTKRCARTAASEREAQLAATLRRHEEMTALVSHDLRNPLSVVLLTARMLNGATPAESEMMAGRLRSAGQRMLRIIEQLTDLTDARLLGGLRVNRSPTSLRPILDRLVTEHRLVQSVAVDLHMDHDVTGDWDESRLEQLVANLLATGARNCDSAGQLELTVTESSTDVHLRLSHPGALTAAELDACFAPFWAKRVGHGTGHETIQLGLYIVDQVALAHGGRATIQSSAPEGTTIHVRLPRS
jgi:two-component system sensor histidine kinase/response regulator